MTHDPHGWLGQATADEKTRFVRRLKPHERDEYDYVFSTTAHAGQMPPDGDWRTWLVMAGRGFGKTRAGAEWVRAMAEADPEARIALVGASLGEVRSVMVEGESGLLACCPPRRRPVFEPSLRRVTFANGALALLYSAGEPESLRGPQHSHAWCDEIGKWPGGTARPVGPGTTCCSACGSAASNGSWRPPRRARCRCCGDCSTATRSR